MNKVLHYAMNIGEQMLLCGADVHRVEECISRICYAFDADRIDVFIITSSMVATIYCKDGSTYTQTRRITNVDTDIEKLHLLNDLSRKICSEHLSFKEIDVPISLTTLPFTLTRPSKIYSSALRREQKPQDAINLFNLILSAIFHQQPFIFFN